MEDDMRQSGAVTPNSPAAQQSPERFKLKGRQRILQSLQRISSQPSLAIMGRSSSGYNGGSKASMSCMSLTSTSIPSPTLGHSYNSSTSSQFSAQLSAGFSTAPTSTSGTPDPNMGCLDMFMRNRNLEEKYDRSGAITPATAPLPSHLGIGIALRPCTSSVQLGDDYFSLATSRVSTPVPAKSAFDLWSQTPDEIKVRIFSFLKPKEIIRCSAVCKNWHKMCFDGQLWTALDASQFYRDIPSETLIKIMTTAGPFVKDLNLRGCVHIRDYWNAESEKIAEVCTNLENFSIEGCQIDRSPLHILLLRNSRLVSINLQGLKVVNNSALKIIGQNCQRLEYLDVSWCQHIDSKGLIQIAQGCRNLRDLRAAEVRGFKDEDLLSEFFDRNTLERLILAHCTDLEDDGLEILLHGRNPEIDLLTGIPLTSARRLKHLDLSRCRSLTDKAVKCIAHTCPNLVGLSLSQCTTLTDDAVLDIVEHAKHLTHLDLEELDLTNHLLTNLVKSPIVTKLTHLNVSFCENIGDTGMLPILKACISLQQLDMDNTRVSDLALTEAAALVRERNRMATSGNPNGRPVVGLNLVDAGEHVLDWVFNGRDVLARRVHFEQRRVERGGLTSTRRTGADHHAEGRVNHLRVVQVGLAREPEL